MCLLKSPWQKATEQCLVILQLYHGFERELVQSPLKSLLYLLFLTWLADRSSNPKTHFPVSFCYPLVAFVTLQINPDVCPQTKLIALWTFLTSVWSADHFRHKVSLMVSVISFNSFFESLSHFLQIILWSLFRSLRRICFILSHGLNLQWLYSSIFYRIAVYWALYNQNSTIEDMHHDQIDATRLLEVVLFFVWL